MIGFRTIVPFIGRFLERANQGQCNLKVGRRVFRRWNLTLTLLIPPRLKRIAVITGAVNRAHPQLLSRIQAAARQANPPAAKYL